MYGLPLQKSRPIPKSWPVQQTETLSISKTLKYLFFLMTSSSRPLLMRIELWLVVVIFTTFILSLFTFLAIKVLIFVIYSRIMNQTRNKRMQLFRNHLSNISRDPSQTNSAQGDNPSSTLVNVFGFFHPNCSARGGGERVLWTGIEAIQAEFPNIICLVYSSNSDLNPSKIVSQAKSAFNVNIDENRVYFETLKNGWLVETATWPRCTMLMQMLGSMILAFEAITLLPPDAFIDTVGYAFAYPLVRFILDIPVCAYVHYPVIGWHSIRNPSFGLLKRGYFLFLYALYKLCGRAAKVVMVNSGWTQEKIATAWGSGTTVYPPCDTAELSRLPLDNRDNNLVLTVAQYRHEKCHPELLRAMKSVIEQRSCTRLVLCGSLRGPQDLEWLERLKSMAADLGIGDNVVFLTDQSWPQLVSLYGKASVGVHPMRDEHFGISVVEFQAAGCLTIAHKSGGPLLDILTPLDEQPTGFLADSDKDYAKYILDALEMPQNDQQKMRMRGRQNSERFSHSNFDIEWLRHMEFLKRLATRMRTMRLLRTNDHINIYEQ